MSAVNSDNMRIARNTIVVYFRLVVTAVIGLLTSRYVLQILGASDFGLYSVIGGVIAMFTFISASLQSTTVRFINYEIGRLEGNLNRVFNIARQIHIFFAIVILIAGEVIGVFYMQHYLNVEPGKMDDAYFVFHVSIAAACLGLVNVPYQGLLVAHEKFVQVACIDILNVVCKLLMVLSLFLCEGNVLRLYAVGMSLLTVMSFVLYLLLCWRYWPQVVKYRMVKGMAQYREMLIFNNYTLLSAASLMGRNQGSNLLINYFFGTIVNAAYAISNTVHVYVNIFAGSFDQASAPQITQSLSRGDNERAIYLVTHTCRICILLVEVVYFAFLYNMDDILHLWLGKNVPEGTTAFCQLTLLLAVVSATSGGLAQYISALGRLKWFSVIMTLLYLVALLVGIVLYRNGAVPYSIVALFILADSINRGFQLLLLRRMAKFPVLRFLREAYWRPAVVFLIGMVVVYLGWQLNLHTVGARMAAMVVVAVLMSVVVFYIGLFKVERDKILSNTISKSNAFYD